MHAVVLANRLLALSRGTELLVDTELPTIEVSVSDAVVVLGGGGGTAVAASDVGGSTMLLRYEQSFSTVQPLLR